MASNEITATINLDNMFADEWGTTVSALVIEELKYAIKREIRTAIKDDVKLKQAITKVRKRVIEQMMEAL